ncbi:acyl carrier protein, partial [Streptomyces sp. NPDC018693]|uniref:acyl carrier protein n=1 Tax=unclassified Streptomyces TaxID=2593676 RepID=UPI0037899855
FVPRTLAHPTAAGLPEKEEPDGLDAGGVRETVLACVADILGHDRPEQVDERRTFKDLGFDSMGALQLHERVTAATGLRLPATLIYDRPTPAELCEHVAALLGHGTDAVPEPEPSAHREPDPVRQALHSASDHEVFDFITKELGIS